MWIGEARVTITDPECTLLDGLSMPQYCGDFAEVLHAFETRAPTLNLERIIEYALKLDAATAKRLGWVLEHQGVEPSKLKRLAALPIRGYRKLDPTGARNEPSIKPLQKRQRLRCLHADPCSIETHLQSRGLSYRMTGWGLTTVTQTRAEFRVVPGTM